MSKYNAGTVVFGNWKVKGQLGSAADYYEIVNEGGASAAMRVISVPGDASEVNKMQAQGVSASDIKEHFFGIVKSTIKELAAAAQLKGNLGIVSYDDCAVIERSDAFGWDILVRTEMLTPLADRIASLTAEDVVKLGIEVSSALDVCAQKGIVHGAIKPENIMIGADGEYKLVGFGEATVADRSSAAFLQGNDAVYTAPEVFGGCEATADADIYSLGIVLYQLFNNNRPPFVPMDRDYTAKERITAISRRNSGANLPAPVNAKGPIVNIVLLACAANSADRFPNASELRNALISVWNNAGFVPAYAGVSLGLDGGDGFGGDAAASAQAAEAAAKAEAERKSAEAAAKAEAERKAAEAAAKAEAERRAAEAAAKAEAERKAAEAAAKAEAERRAAEAAAKAEAERKAAEAAAKAEAERKAAEAAAKAEAERRAAEAAAKAEAERKAAEAAAKAEAERRAAEAAAKAEAERKAAEAAARAEAERAAAEAAAKAEAAAEAKAKAEAAARAEAAAKAEAERAAAEAAAKAEALAKAAERCAATSTAAPVENTEKNKTKPAKPAKPAKEKKEKSKLPIIIAIAAVLLVLGAAAVVMYMMFGGGDGETTTDAVYTTTAPDTVAVTTAETEVIAEVTEDATPDVVALADGSKEYYTYGADGSVTAKRVEDAYGNVVARYEYADGVCVSEKNYASNGQLVYEVKIENGTKTVTEYYRTAEGAMAGGTKTVYSEDGNLIEIDTLNEYGNPVEIEFYENNELKFTRTYNIENGARVGYTDTYTDGKTVNYDMNGNEVKKPAETTATTKKPTATKPATTTAATTAATEPKPAATTYTESTGWSAAGSKIDKIYSTSTGALLKEITYQKINGQAYEKQVIDYTTSPRQKTVYERSTNGSITRTLYYQFNQNPGNYTKLIVKDANGSITKYEGYKRDDNGKIMITYIYDTAGTLQYYIKHESHGNYKYGADDSYLGKA